MSDARVLPSWADDLRRRYLRGESAIMPGYGLEPFLQREALDHLLEIASPAWETGHWAEGLAMVLDGLDKLLESIAIPEEAAAKRNGEF